MTHQPPVAPDAFGRYVVAVSEVVAARGQAGGAGSADVLLAAFRQGLSVEQAAALAVGTGATN